MQPALEARAVGEAGARVDERTLAQLALQLALLGQVAQREHDALDVGIVDAVGHAQVGVDGVTGGVTQQDVTLGGVGHATGGDQEVDEPAAVLRVHERVEAGAAERGGGPAEQRHDGVGDERDGAALVDHEHRVGRVLDERAEAALGLEQRRALAGCTGRVGALALGGAAAASGGDQQHTGEQQRQDAGPDGELPGAHVVAGGRGGRAVDLRSSRESIVTSSAPMWTSRSAAAPLSPRALASSASLPALRSERAAVRRVADSALRATTTLSRSR